MDGAFNLAWIGPAILLAMREASKYRGRREARRQLQRAKKLEAAGDTARALEAAREAKRLMPLEAEGGLTLEHADMATFAAVLEERREREREAEAAARRAAAPQPEAPATRPASELRPGTDLGEYVLEQKIGEGGAGEVWRARHSRLGARAAVKIPVRGEAAALEELARLARIQRRLDHPRIVRVLGADLDGKRPYVAMELVEGTDLRRLIAGEKHLAPGRALRILEEALEALVAAHAEGILHRDLKPESILVTHGGAVKVTDFDLGRGHGQLTGEAVDARADIHALGVILFEMVTGERPQPGDAPSRHVQGLPPACDELFARCTARLEERFPSAREALEAVKQARVKPGVA